jgi:hypothetical protein
VTTTFPFGFRVLGAVTGDRRLVDWQAAFAAYAAVDSRCEPDRESYLSSFTYGPDLHARADSWGIISTADFEGPCWTPWLWIDVDRAGDLDLALQETRRLALFLDGRYQLQSEDDLLIFLSGGKGFHAGLPTSLWCPESSADFHDVARRFAARLAELAGLGVYNSKRGYRIDEGAYLKVQLFRAPNSRHPKSGLHKRRLSFDELMNLSAERILQLAQGPEPFDIPTPGNRSDQAARDWAEAVAAVRKESAGRQRCQAAGDGKPTLNRGTREFICRGAEEGDRHRLLFSAAANLGEFPSVEALAYALLREPGLDSGLPPSDVDRQIRCGLEHARKGTGGAGEPTPPADLPAGQQDVRAALAAAWATQAAQAAPTAPTPSAAPPPPGPPPGTEPSGQLAGDVQAQLAALWSEADGAEAALELAEEREAIEATGGRPDPPSPPAGVGFIYRDAGGRSCERAPSTMWS